MSYSENGIALQTYAAILACLLSALWTGRRPSLRSYEMLCYYFSGWADLEEVEAHIARLPQQPVTALGDDLPASRRSGSSPSMLRKTPVLWPSATPASPKRTP